MKTLLKKGLPFVLFLFIYFLPSLIFRQDNNFYQNLEGNFVPPIVFVIVWSIIYLILAFINTYYLLNKDKFNQKELKHYAVLTIINYIFNFLFPLSFFVYHNLFLGYITTLLVCVTAILMAMQSLLLNKKITFLFLPYILWTIFATVYSILLYLKN